MSGHGDAQPMKSRKSGPLGGVASVPWAMLFPKELGPDEPPLAAIRDNEIVRANLREILAPRHPSQLYQIALEGVLLFVLLWW